MSEHPDPVMKILLDHLSPLVDPMTGGGGYTFHAGLPQVLAERIYQDLIATGLLKSPEHQRVWIAANGHAMGGYWACAVGSRLSSCQVHDDGNARPPSIADSCCGKCEGGNCYVDGVTGA